MTSEDETKISTPSMAAEPEERYQEQVEVTTGEASTAMGSTQSGFPGTDQDPYHHVVVHLQQDLEDGRQSCADSGEELGGAERNLPKATQEKSRWQFHPLEALKYVLSLALTLFCIVVVSAAIFTKQTIATGEKNVHPAFAYFVFWALILWLATMEGALNCMVGLKPLDKTLYQNSHTRTYKCTALAHKGDNLERFIVGRQYLDLTCVFLTSFMVSTIDGASVLGLPDIVNEIFLGAGVGVILVTIIFGQLIAVIICAHSMLDYMNSYILLIITYVALTVEASGILHSVYLVQILFSSIFCKPMKSNEPPKSTWQSIGFWGRVAMSSVILMFAFAVSLTALFQSSTAMWEGVPPVVSLLLLIILIGITGIMEGLQIAFFAVVHLPSEVIESTPLAKFNCDLIFHKASTNFRSF